MKTLIDAIDKRIAKFKAQLQKDHHANEKTNCMMCQELHIRILELQYIRRYAKELQKECEGVDKQEKKKREFYY